MDLDKTLEESEWSEIVQKVKRLENRVMELEERTEASKSKIKFKSVELSDISKTVYVLTKVVSEQN